jgi:hypothetical protein
LDNPSIVQIKRGVCGIDFFSFSFSFFSNKNMRFQSKENCKKDRAMRAMRLEYVNSLTLSPFTNKEIKTK